MPHPNSYSQEGNPPQILAHERYIQHDGSVSGSFHNVPPPNTRLMVPTAQSTQICQQMYNNIQSPTIPTNVPNFSHPVPMGQLPIHPRPHFNPPDYDKNGADKRSYYNIQGSSFNHPPPQLPHKVVPPEGFFMPENQPNMSRPCPPRIKTIMPIDFARPPPVFHTQRTVFRSPFLPVHAVQPRLSPDVQIASLNSMSKKKRGSELLKRWSQKQENMKRTVKKAESFTPEKDSLKMWECVHQLSEVKRILSSLSSQIDSMDSILTVADKKTWEEGLWMIESDKNKLKTSEPFLEKSVFYNTVKSLELSKTKRVRLKRGRQQKSDQQELQKEEWNLKKRKIDEWQEKVMKKIRDDCMIAKRKAKADRTLSKVSKEIQDANKLIDTMTALQKLRLIRRDAAEKRGDADLGESRQTFEQKIADMIRLVKAQLEHYKDEEKKLKSIIKSEVEENERKLEEINLKAERMKQSTEDAELGTLIFGSEGEIEAADPLYPFVQYYKQAEQNLQAFLQIRHEWDSYCVPKTSPGGSHIPSMWVVPAEPSSSVWASAQI